MCTLTLSMHDVQDKKHSELYLGRMRLLRKSRGVLGSCVLVSFFFFSSRRRHTRYWRDWSSDVCSSDLWPGAPAPPSPPSRHGRGGAAPPSGAPARCCGPPSRPQPHSESRAGPAPSQDRKSVV